MADGNAQDDVAHQGRDVVGPVGGVAEEMRRVDPFDLEAEQAAAEADGGPVADVAILHVAPERAADGGAHHGIGGGGAGGGEGNRGGGGGGGAGDLGVPLCPRAAPP